MLVLNPEYPRLVLVDTNPHCILYRSCILKMSFYTRRQPRLYLPVVYRALKKKASIYWTLTSPYPLLRRKKKTYLVGNLNDWEGSGSVPPGRTETDLRDGILCLGPLETSLKPNTVTGSACNKRKRECRISVIPVSFFLKLENRQLWLERVKGEVTGAEKAKRQGPSLWRFRKYWGELKRVGVRWESFFFFFFFKE